MQKIDGMFQESSSTMIRLSDGARAGDALVGVEFLDQLLHRQFTIGSQFWMEYAKGSVTVAAGSKDRGALKEDDTVEVAHHGRDKGNDTAMAHTWL